MSTDREHAAIEQADAEAGFSSLRSTQAPMRELVDRVDLATALVRIEAVIALGAEQELDKSTAFDCIAHVGVMLHERDVERSVLDALDAAFDEIRDGGGRFRSSAEWSDRVVALLRYLSHRIKDMIRDGDAEQFTAIPEDGIEQFAEIAEDVVSSEPASFVPEPEMANRNGRRDETRNADAYPHHIPSETDAAEQNKFVRMIETMTASLRSLADRAPSAGLRDGAGSIAHWPDLAALLEAPAGQAREMGAQEPEMGAQERRPLSSATALSEGLAMKAVLTELSALESSLGAKASGARTADEVLSLAPRPDAEQPFGPGDDPGDLFESVAAAPVVAPVRRVRPARPLRPSAPIAPPLDLNDLIADAALVVAPPRMAKAASPDPSPAGSNMPAAKEQPRAVAAKNPPAMPAPPPLPPPQRPARPAAGTAPPAPAARPLVNDPLAPLRALSEEELIALFS
jgi:hypothetical protein